MTNSKLTRQVLVFGLLERGDLALLFGGGRAGPLDPKRRGSPPGAARTGLPANPKVRPTFSF